MSCAPAFPSPADAAETTAAAEAAAAAPVPSFAAAPEHAAADSCFAAAPQPAASAPEPAAHDDAPCKEIATADDAPAAIGSFGHLSTRVRLELVCQSQVVS